MDNTQFLDLPCPYCACYTLSDTKAVECSTCKTSLKRRPLKTAYDYASFVFTYGHQYREYYEAQLEEKNTITSRGNLEPPHPLHTAISLPLISGIVGSTSWFLVKTAITTITESYNAKNETDFEVAEEDIRHLNRNFREFINNFAEVDATLRNAVFEQMFVDECSAKEKTKHLKLRQDAEKASGDKQKELVSQADAMLDMLMKKTFKKITEKEKPTQEELSSFWLQVIR